MTFFLLIPWISMPECHFLIPFNFLDWKIHIIDTLFQATPLCANCLCKCSKPALHTFEFSTLAFNYQLANNICLNMVTKRESKSMTLWRYSYRSPLAWTRLGSWIRVACLLWPALGKRWESKLSVSLSVTVWALVSISALLLSCWLIVSIALGQLLDKLLASLLTEIALALGRLLERGRWFYLYFYVNLL